MLVQRQAAAKPPPCHLDHAALLPGSVQASASRPGRAHPLLARSRSAACGWTPRPRCPARRPLLRWWGWPPTGLPRTPPPARPGSAPCDRGPPAAAPASERVGAGWARVGQAAAAVVPGSAPEGLAPTMRGCSRTCAAPSLKGEGGSARASRSWPGRADCCTGRREIRPLLCCCMRWGRCEGALASARGCAAAHKAILALLQAAGGQAARWAPGRGSKEAVAVC